MQKFYFSIASLALASLMTCTPMVSAQTASGSAPAASSQSTTSSPASKTGTAAKKTTTTGKPATPLTLKTQSQKFSYAVGMRMGKSFHQQSLAVDPAILARGIRDAMAGGKTLLTDEEAQAAIGDVQKQVQMKMQAKMQEKADANKKTGEDFLEANKSKEGVVVLPSGLQYKILTQGTGAKPTADDTVECNYRGTLIDGTEFDSSYKRGQAVSFQVGGVIKGWTEALQLMPVGSKWQLFIPPDLAYGERGAGGDIGPDETLIFEVELISIKSKDAAPHGTPSPDTGTEEKK
jgi:FKBP-type peptidyl-prolyl cis-trans isomerase FklB